jgi:hypothetical protein
MPKHPVGYGKPPKHTRFRKGRSVNPKGRPKGSKNLGTILLGAVNERVTVTDESGSRKLSKLEVMHKQLANKGATGDLRAFQIISQKLEQLEDRSQSASGSSAFDESDQQVIRELERRFRRITKQNPDG